MDNVNAAIAKAEQEGPGPVGAAWNELQMFPRCTLSDNRDSKRRGTRLNKRLGKFLGGEKLQAPDTKTMSGRQKRAYKRKWDWKLAEILQQQLKRGNITRASQCLDQAELAEPTLETMQKLAELQHNQTNLR